MPGFELPPRSKVGYLDTELADDGQKVILGDGEQVSWSPPPARLTMPDMSQIKSIAHYFNRRGYQVYPAWLYHPSEEPRLVKNGEEALSLGIVYRKATLDEKGRYGLEWVWDWEDGCQWRPKPYVAVKFDPSKPGQGKTYVPQPANPATQHNQLLETLIPAVAAAVAKSLRAEGPAAPANIDPKQWDAFLEFQAFQKTRETVDAVADEAARQTVVDASEEQQSDANALSPEQDRALWTAEAERQGIKVDKRWGVDRIKSEIEKKAA